MSGVGGDITELLRRLGVDALVDEAERAGLSPRGKRMKCPWPGCEDKGPERKRSAVASVLNGHPRVHCYACNKPGDFVDLLERTRGLSRAEAIAFVQGAPVPDRPKPELRVVGSRPPDEAGKLLPAEVQRIWDELARTSDLCRPYLVKRSLVGAVDAGLVRFATEDSKHKEVALHAAKNRRIACLLSDVVGNARGIQLRVAGEVRGKEPKVLSIKGSVTSRAFFGQPAAVAGAPVVAVAEGMADTLALQLWAEQGATVVGAAGMSFLPKLAEELELAGVDVEEKLFALFPQNDDRHAPNSLSLFTRLAQLLRARGARVVIVPTPAEYKDLAEWRNAAPSTPWPPAKLEAAFVDEPGDDHERKTVLPEGAALPIPVKVEAEKYAQNFRTLVALLDDPATRETLLNTREEVSYCTMTTRVRVGGRIVVEDDIPKIRLQLELFTRSTDGKPLQFKESDIKKALTLVAQRNSVHEIRRWLHSLPKWNGTPLLETEFPKVLGHDAGSFEGRLLRRWAVSAVARLEEPGCQVDTVLILTGNQAAKKTSFFRTLGGQYTTSSKVEPGDKDGMMIMREYWIIEWGELSSMHARSRNVTKDFITNPVDTFREPYGRDLTKAKRHCVLVGTANETDILEDPTGSRRYWPIEVLTEKISMSWLREHRDQLFAEALALYRGSVGCAACRADEDGRCSDHRWWLMPDEERILKERNRAFEVDEHPWLGLIENWLTWPEVNHLEFVTTGQVLKAAINIKEENWTTNDARTVANAMKQLGWRSGRDSIGSRQRGWLRPRSHT